MTRDDIAALIRRICHHGFSFSLAGAFIGPIVAASVLPPERYSVAAALMAAGSALLVSACAALLFFLLGRATSGGAVGTGADRELPARTNR